MKNKGEVKIMTENYRIINGLILDCMLHDMANPAMCIKEDCPTCGWNPEVDEERKKKSVLKMHKSGLRGF